MNKSNFSKPPMTDKEREEKLQAFINLSDTPITKKEEPKGKFKKEKIKTFCLRLPESLFEDMHEIMARTSLSMNAICLEMLRPEIKRKLKELRED